MNRYLELLDVDVEMAKGYDGTYYIAGCMLRLIIDLWRHGVPVKTLVEAYELCSGFPSTLAVLSIDEKGRAGE